MKNFSQALNFKHNASSLMSVLISTMLILFLMSWSVYIFEQSTAPENIKIQQLRARLYVEYLTLQACKKIETLENLPDSKNYKLENGKVQTFYDKALLKNISSENLYIFTLNYSYGDLGDTVTRAKKNYFDVDVP